MGCSELPGDTTYPHMISVSYLENPAYASAVELERIADELLRQQSRRQGKRVS